MQQLKIQEKLIFRNVRKAAIVWLLIIRLDPQPVTETIAAETLQIDKETARKYLRTLHECEIITRLGRYKGYTLTDGGRQLTLPLQMQILQGGSAEFPRSEDLKALNLTTTKKNTIDKNPLIVVVKALKALIKSERGKTALERGNSALERFQYALEIIEGTAPMPSERGNSALPDTPVDKNQKSVDNYGLEIDEMVAKIIAENPAKEAILKELLACRIGMNWKTLALLHADDLTVTEIRSQYHFLEKKGRENETGILITNLLAAFKPKGADFDPETGHPVECNCYKCIGARNSRFMENIQSPEQMQKYAEWED